MKVNIKDIMGRVVKDDLTYLLKDNTSLVHLVLSSTALHPNQSTRGHKHQGQEEVYIFVSGAGTMELDDKTINVDPGDVVLIEDGVYHRVHNPSDVDDLYFVCIFEGKRNH